MVNQLPWSKNYNINILKTIQYWTHLSNCIMLGKKSYIVVDRCLQKSNFISNNASWAAMKHIQLEIYIYWIFCTFITAPCGSIILVKATKYTGWHGSTFQSWLQWLQLAFDVLVTISSQIWCHQHCVLAIAITWQLPLTRLLNLPQFKATAANHPVTSSFSWSDQLVTKVLKTVDLYKI